MLMLMCPDASYMLPIFIDIRLSHGLHNLQDFVVVFMFHPNLEMKQRNETDDGSCIPGPICHTTEHRQVSEVA